MPIGTNCPICGKRLRIPEELVGKRVKCFCGTVFTAKATPSAAINSTPQTTESTAPEKPDEDGGKRRFKLPDDFPFDIESVRNECKTAAGSILPIVLTACIAVTVAVAGWGITLSKMGDPIAENLRESLFPAIIAVIIGAGYGFGLGNRLAEKAGVVGVVGCVIGLAAVASLVIVTHFAGRVFMDAPLPDMWRLVVFCIGFMATLGVSYFTLWAG